ncbi:uncharacterized protein LOC127131350 [Lathyrus oleraceus]|uniref:uncharacterized protein LOC127131350 n=1 Tax=Pisum sativum TaxID=3888 RepID=UPI0021D25B03|nr:uncharacterized protein LOC127131350 [Pisum sativum]
MVSFKDCAPNVKANQLPAHGNSSMNMVEGCLGKYNVFDVRCIRRYLVEMHKTLCLISDCEHDHDGCTICSVNSRGCMIVKRAIPKMIDEGMIQINQARDLGDDVNVIVPVFKTPEPVVIQFDSSKRSNRSVSPLVIRLAGPVPYTSDKAVPYKYDATMIKDGKKVPLLAINSVVRIIDVVKVTRNGRVFSPVSPKVVEDVVVGKKAEVVVPVVDPVNAPIFQSGESSSLKSKDDNDEVLRLIKKSEFNVGEQLLQRSSKIFVLSLLMNFEAHREALQKSFYDEELPEEGMNHNLALHISMNCKEDALSNILVDIGSSLNIIPKSTLASLSHKGASIRYSGVMNIHPTYSCLSGMPWIHEASAVTSTLHQKPKFLKNGKFVIVGGEKALLASHLSYFTYVEAEEEVGIPFQALSVANVIQKTVESMSSLKDTREIVQADDTVLPQEISKAC